MLTPARTIAAALLLRAALPATPAAARIEIFLMERTHGIRPPPLPNDIRFRGTPFGHMALYIESAVPDEEQIIRQAAEGEPGGLVLTVDKDLRDAFFVAFPRDEFFLGPLDPARPPERVGRAEIAGALERFNAAFGHLYLAGPGISGFGQDYGVLFVRSVRGLVYQTTREEEARIIEHWQRRRHDDFVPMTNNCVTTIQASLRHAGLDDRSFFIRGLAPYNAWVYCVERYALAGPGEIAPNGNRLRRDGTGATFYTQIESDAMYRSGRPFNVYTLKRVERLAAMVPPAEADLPSAEPVRFGSYPAGDEEPAEGRRRGGALGRAATGALSRGKEFVRLWFQSFDGLWFLAAG
ncbi:MAG: hypothetical protein PHN82_07730 [bacterium]|nr:hypothetical protein [bacterium]